MNIYDIPTIPTITTTHIENVNIKPYERYNQSDYFMTIRKAEEIDNLNREDINDFKEKAEILNTYFEKETLRDFFRAIFPKGTLQKIGSWNDKKPNIIVMSNSNKYYAKKSRYVKKAYIIFDELENLEYFEEAEDAIFVPVSFIGNRRLNINAGKVHCITFDIDGVTPEHLRVLLHKIELNLLPRPTYITNSGHGLHLYFVLKYPISAKISNLRELTNLKYALTDILWTKHTSNIKKTQYQSITQGFRLPGSSTKFGKGYNTEVFRSGEMTTLSELMTYLRYQSETIDIMALEPILQKEEKNDDIDCHVSNSKKKKPDFYSIESKIRRITSKYDISHLETLNQISLKEAKERYPDWYAKRVVKNQPRGSWRIKESVYEWWLEKMQNEIKVGSRYHSVAVLSALAFKAQVSFERLKEDAYSIIQHYNQLENSNNNLFTAKDVDAALTMYNEKNVYMSLKAIEKKTGIDIKRNKRNGLTRAENLKEARLKQQQYLEEGSNWRQYNGRKPKEDKVRAYIMKYPGRTPTQYSVELGISRPTIYKYLKIHSSEQ